MCLELFLNSPEKRKVLLPSFPCSIFNHVEAKSHSSETWLCSPSYLEALCMLSRPRPPRRPFPPNTEATVPIEKYVQVKITSSL